MMNYEIVGLRRYDFTAQNTGERMLGYNVYVTLADPSDSRLQGVETNSFSISDQRLGSYLPSIGDRIFISWQDKRNRRVESIMPID